jgi:glutamate dehydrogenase/leucine dehydrogenase
MPSIAPLAEIDLDDIGPERIIHFYEPRSQLRAVLIIDTLRYGLTAGGVRMAADLSLEEMVRLARAMTCKFAMLGLPCGGAKAGIWLDPADASRPEVMRAFLEAIRPLVQARQYLPGADMGTAAADFSPLHTDSGRQTNLGEEIVDGMPLEEQLTGYGVVVAAKTACEALGRSLAGARVALEGFGKVGAGVARFLLREGARLVAVSNIHGTLEDADGLDIEALLALRAAHGDESLQRYTPTQPLLPQTLILAVDADIFVPGARPDRIDAEVAAVMPVRLVVPAANIPYAPGAVEALSQRGIVALPDFVTNAGGVLAGLVEMQGGRADDAFRTTRERIDSNVRLLMERAAGSGSSPYDTAVQIVRERWAGGRP